MLHIGKVVSLIMNHMLNFYIVTLKIYLHPPFGHEWTNWILGHLYSELNIIFIGCAFVCGLDVLVGVESWLASAE